MTQKLHYIILLLLSVLLMCSCGGNKKNNGDKKEMPDGIKVSVPVFNADSAYAMTARQVEFGPRVPGSKAHEQCATYLEQKLRSYKLEVIVQKAVVRAYNGKNLNGKNIIGQYNLKAPSRILLCAHWDSRPYADQDRDSTKHRTAIDGANDGASGVGVLLEVARILCQNKPDVGVDIIFFDVEDYGEPQDDRNEYDSENWGLGSQYWSKNPHVPNYRARFGILLDMVGASGALFAREGFSEQYAPDVLNKVWDAASRAGFSGQFIAERSNPINDDHYYINKYIMIPTIDIIQYDRNTRSGFYTNWHTMNDKMDFIDRSTLKAVGQTLLTVIFEEARPAS